MTQFLNRLPNNTFYLIAWLVGGREYSRQYADDMTCLEYWWRQFFHFMGGLILGILIPFWIVLPVMMFKEFYDGDGKGIKPILDSIMWGLGALVSNAIF